MLKEEILNNLNKTKQYVRPSFLKEHSLTSKECFDILYPEKIKKCKYCGNECEFIKFSSGYKDICNSKECKHKHRIETVKKTNLEKYGYEFVAQVPEIKQKIKQTIFDHYGTYDYLNSEQNRHNMYDENGVHKAQTEEVKKRRKETNLKRYGTNDLFSINDNAGRKKSNSKEGREKAKQTLMKSYGVTSTRKLEKTKETIRNTTKERYGEEAFFKTKEFRDKSLKTHLEKYGTEWYTQTDEYKQRVIKTCNEKYNADYYLSSELRRQREIEKGNWVSNEEREGFDGYRTLVTIITNHQDLKSLENFEKRGNIKYNPDAYHLDHKFSIKEGYIQNIPPEIIGNIKNLEMLPALDNIRKSRKCSITKEELLNDCKE